MNKPPPVGNEDWICSHCGRVNALTVRVCAGCANPLDVSDALLAKEIPPFVSSAPPVRPTPPKPKPQTPKPQAKPEPPKQPVFKTLPVDRKSTPKAVWAPPPKVKNTWRLPIIIAILFFSVLLYLVLGYIAIKPNEDGVSMHMDWKIENAGADIEWQNAFQGTDRWELKQSLWIYDLEDDFTKERKEQLKEESGKIGR